MIRTDQEATTLQRSDANSLQLNATTAVKRGPTIAFYSDGW